MYYETIRGPASYESDYPSDKTTDIYQFIINLDPSLDTVQAKLMVEAFTDNTLGIRNLETSSKNPVPFILKDKKLVTNSVLRSTYKQIMDSKMVVHSGMSMDELLNLDTVDFNIIFELSKDYETRANKESSPPP